MIEPLEHRDTAPSLATADRPALPAAPLDPGSAVEPRPSCASWTLRVRGRLRLICAGLLLVSTGIATGCSDEGSDEVLAPPENVSFASQVQPIFTASCTFSDCHAGQTPTGDMNLTEGNAYASTVGASASNTYPGKIRVVPGQPETSLLYQKITTKDFGAQMPLRGSITQRQRDIIKAWIEEGALDN
jgi:hypothetical protein